MTLVYDGDCAFCCRCASWIRERSGIDMSAGSPEDLAALELSLEDAKRSVWWIEDGVRLAGHAAIGKALRQVVRHHVKNEDLCCDEFYSE